MTSPEITNAHRAALERFRFLPVIRQILTRLPLDLPENLRYHASAHTDEVLSETVLFAICDGVQDRELELLAIAAAYHDAGYIERYPNNEEIGAAMAAEAMQLQGRYSEAEIDQVEQMILSTSFSQTMRRTQRTPLSGYLMDADWGAFGRDDFFEKCQLLIEETGAEPDAFYRQTLELVRNHSWQTPAAHALREDRKCKNIRALQLKLERSDDVRFENASPVRGQNPT
ncbi:MAG: hypothetical protein HY646_09295 [Acidobacteria bacterium]|nr:hypothetical protein [Acidobacteriota bacterium]